MSELAPRRAALACAALALFTLLCLFDPGSPAPLSADAAPERFSAARAWPALEQLTREPHPLGSPAQARAQAFLEGELERLGVEWERLPWTLHVNGRELSGTNLRARLPGHESGAARVLFVAHHDSVPEAPGAGDDGAAVAAMLECLRALAREGPRRNTLEFLSTDGEEAGLLGARAFVETPGELEGVACVLNFEGRGNAGPAILFETGAHDRAWIAAYAACATRPLGSSLGPAVYERMPNDTDFTLFRRRGLPGLNFAWVGGGSAYHRPADTSAHLDPRALQHHGETMLALARELGDADLAALAAERGRATFFTLPGNLLVHYAARWDGAVVALAALAVGAALAAALRARRISPAGLALGFLATPVAAVLCMLLLAAGAQAARTLASAALPATTAPRGNGASTTWLTLGTAVLGFALASLAARRLGPRTRGGLAAGAFVVWSLLAALASAYLSGASHALAWPTLCAAGVFAGCGHLAGGGARTRSAALVVALCSAGFLALTLPVLAQLHQVGSVRPTDGVGYAAALVALALPLALPLAALVGAWRGSRSGAMLLFAAAIPLATGALLEALGR